MEEQEDMASVAESAASVASQPDCSAAQSFAGLRERPILFSGPMVRALLDGRKTQTRRILTRHNSTVLGSKWGRSAPWAGLRFTEAMVRLRSPAAGVHEPHLAVPFCHPDDEPMESEECGIYRVRPVWAPGDLLWVRESGLESTRAKTFRLFRHDAAIGAGGNYWVDSDGGRYGAGYGPAITRERQISAGGWKVRPSIHMPRWASRITLRITDVRVERLQDISEADAIAEGLYKSFPDDEDREWYRGYSEDRGEVPDWVSFEAGVWMAPGVPQGWGLNKADRQRDQWAPTAQFAYRLIWEHINGPGSWSANPWVWAVTFERIAPSSEEPTSRVRRAEPELSTLPGISS